MNFDIGKRSSVTLAHKTLRAGVASLLCLLCVAFLYRTQISADFNFLSGDKYDAVIAASILEHWRDFFSGTAAWADARYFYPYANTLAQTDGYFLVGLIYTPFRYLGLDPFTSAEASAMVVKGLGFFGMYWMCRAILKIDFQWALFAALIFTLSNGMTSHNSRVQLATVAFAPYIFVMFWRAWESFRFSPNSRHGYFWASGAVLLYGAWCLTCFYMAWFFAYFLLVTGALAIVFWRKQFVGGFMFFVRAYWKPMLFISLLALFSVLPFISLYMPKAGETGVRSYLDALSGATPLLGVAEVGQSNMMFGEIYAKLVDRLSGNYSRASEYYNTGFNLALLFIFGASVFFFRKASVKGGIYSFYWLIIISTLVSWAVTLRFGSISGWTFVYHLVPGAKALRVISAYQLFIAIPVIAFVAKYLDSRGLSRGIAIFFFVFLAAAEINTPYINLNRDEELKRVAVESPPLDCNSFYVSAWEDQERDDLGEIESLYAHNVSAMLIAQLVDLPTINGFASYNPKDWNFSNPGGEGYDTRMKNFADSHGIRLGLCKLDLNDKSWQLVP